MKEYSFVVIEKVRKTVSVIADNLAEARKEMSYLLDNGAVDMDKNPDEISQTFYVVDVAPVKEKAVLEGRNT